VFEHGQQLDSVVHMYKLASVIINSHFCKIQHAMYFPECKYSIRSGVTAQNISGVHSTLMISRNHIDLLTVRRTVLLQLLTDIESG